MGGNDNYFLFSLIFLFLATATEDIMYIENPATTIMNPYNENPPLLR
jgi:hypothetical protein